MHADGYLDELGGAGHPCHDVAQRLQADHTLRSVDVQRKVLGVQLGDLAQELMHRWQLPDLLIRCTDDRKAQDPTVRTTMLGVRIARHAVQRMPPQTGSQVSCARRACFA